MSEREGAAKEFAGALHSLASVVNKADEVLVAEVTVALPLDDEDRQKLKQALASFAGREVEISENVDPDIIGGVVVQLKDRVFLGSVAHRLGMLREQIAGGVESA